MPDAHSLCCHFAWFELMTDDTAAADAFYTSVVGWTTSPVGTADVPYTTFNVEGIGIAGLMMSPKEAGPVHAWIGYIHVPDVDSHVAQVEAAGGRLHKGPTDVPGMLRFAVISDPQGAPIVLFTPNSAMPANPVKRAPGTPGTIAWTELMTSDPEAAFGFYAPLFGWTQGAAFDMGPMGLYRQFQIDGVPTGGMMKTPPGVSGSFWNYSFYVESAKAAAEKILACGGKVVNGPMKVPGASWNWMVQAVDPQGAGFRLLSAEA